MANNIKYCLLTNDVETTSIWHNDLRDSTGFKVYKEGMPLLLNIYRKYNVKSTFYFTGHIAKLIPDIVKMVLKDGHEVGSHGLRHEKEFGFDVMSLDSQIEHLKESKKSFIDVKLERQETFCDSTQKKLEKFSWGSGCNSWYLSENGKNYSIWPSFTPSYWWKTRKFDATSYHVS